MTPRASASSEFKPSDFFVLRTPLLPFDAFEQWGERLRTPAEGSDGADLESACASDRRLLRERLRKIIALPEVRSALLIAAPDLEGRLATWEHDPDGARGARIELALVRYFTRMATRPTPFGLFAGNSVGRLGPVTRLAVGPRQEARPRTRLDMDYLDTVAGTLSREPAIRARLKLYPNNTLYPCGERLRYVEARGRGASRAYHLVAAEPSDYLKSTLERAAPGASIGELAAPLAKETEVSLEEADAYIAQLIDSQILVPELTPPVTSADAIDDLLRTLRARGADGEMPGRLESLHRQLREQDEAGVGAGPDRYRAIIDELPVPLEEPELPYLFQVDLMRNAKEAMIGPDLIGELTRAVQLLHRITPSRPPGPLDRFRDAFLERYSGEEVPLTEALDPEVGIGFDVSDSRLESAPLLEGIAFPDPARDTRRERTALLHGFLSKARSPAGAEIPSIELDESDLEALESPRKGPLPDAFAVLATIAAESEAAIAAGRFQVILEFALGPSGARLMGRFCHADPELRAAVERHLREEEALRPEAVFAEIVHMPEGRLGNVVCRPPLRSYDLPFLGRSGAPPERQILLSDLRVTVSDGRVVLKSARLDREVIPSLTSAHNFGWRSLGIYHFLCSLQAQGVSERAFWDWGPLETAPYLPRLTHGRFVIARARWRVVRDEVKPFTGLRGAALIRGVREWRVARRLPRLLLLTEADNRLLVDFENVLSLDSFLHLARTRSDLTLTEFLPGPGALAAEGPDGRYTHEILVPFVRAARTMPPAAPSKAAAAPPVRRVYLPGSEWLFAKVYTGVAGADQVLRRIVAPLIQRLHGEGHSSVPWFFLRYGDPAWHIRLRIQGEPRWLRDVAAPALEDLVGPLLESRTVWRLSYDTYQREVERYGGPLGIELSERIFECDSRCALDLIRMLSGDEGLEARGILAIRGADGMLEDFGFETREKRGLLGRMREGIAAQLGVDRDFERQLDAAFRKRRPALERLFNLDVMREPELGACLKRFEERSETTAPIAREIAQLSRSGRLSGSLEGIAGSHVHMHTNRLLRGAHGAQELVIYDALCRLYDSWEARRLRTR